MARAAHQALTWAAPVADAAPVQFLQPLEPPQPPVQVRPLPARLPDVVDAVERPGRVVLPEQPELPAPVVAERPLPEARRQRPDVVERQRRLQRRVRLHRRLAEVAEAVATRRPTRVRSNVRLWTPTPRWRPSIASFKS